MPKKEPAKASRRVRERDALLKKALQNPGIEEFLQVYRDWEKVDRGLDAYRRATKEPSKVITTDNGNLR